MTPDAIIDQLKARGIRLQRDGDALLAIPKNQLTDELRTLIREHKAELLQVVGDHEVHRNEAEVRRLVAMIYSKDTPEDQAEALRHALSDPVGALECYRWILSGSVH